MLKLARFGCLVGANSFIGFIQCHTPALKFIHATSLHKITCGVTNSSLICDQVGKRTLSYNKAESKPNKMSGEIPPPQKDLKIKFKQLFINNEFVDAQSGKQFEVINPATSEVICKVAIL